MWTAIFDLYVVRCGSKNGHQKDIMCSKDIGLPAQKFVNCSRLISQHNVGGGGATWSFHGSNTVKNHSSSRGDQKSPQIVAKFHITFVSPQKNINSEIQVWESWQTATINHLRHIYPNQPGIEMCVPAWSESAASRAIIFVPVYRLWEHTCAYIFSF